MLVTILSTLVVLSVLILVHEFGHFFAAKSVDIEVTRFSLGMGPRVAGFRAGETEFVLSALPVGGYVSMAGMEDDETAVLEGGHDAGPRQPSPRDFDAKPLWARAWVVSAGVIMNLLFAWLVYAGLGVAYGERIVRTDRIAVVSPDRLPEGATELARVANGSRVVAVGERAVANWTEVEQALLRAAPGAVSVRFAGGETVALDLPASDSARFALVGALQPLLPPVVAGVQAGSPAARAGLQTGDRIVSVAGERVGSFQDVVRLVRPRAGVSLPVVARRGDEQLAVSLTPAAGLDTLPGGRIVRVGQIGVLYPRPAVDHRRLGVGAAIARGAELTWDNTTLIFRFLGRLFSGGESPRSVGSILTVGQISGQTARLGAEPFLAFLALFSVNLAVLNLLPIPVLDGGHLLFMAIEAVRGRPLSVEQRMRLSQAGLFVVIGIMLWAMTNDVLRVFGV